MRVHHALAVAAAALGFLGSAGAQQTTPQPLAVTIDARQTATPVSPYLFGMFIEHIGTTMYRPLWAEMLDDRKFYFPITATDAKPATGPMFPGMVLRKWRPIGPESAITMDKEKPFVGDQSPTIALDATAPHGLRQAGLGLVKGKAYVGRIVVKGTPGAHVKVALVWGPEAHDRASVDAGTLTAAYRTVPLRFTAAADATDAALEIAGSGVGSFEVGAVSLMPADNVEGFRPDTIALLRQIKSGFWRFGGNYTSNYTWYDAIGDRDRRPSTFDYAWNAMQSNDLGMDEFATLCRLIGVEPYISVNAGFGDAHSAAEQVEYMNGAATTHMGALRARNGHPAPYHVKFWNIGNEPWGAWQLGRTDLKYFMLKHNEFAKAMRKVDPSITLIASGEMLEDGNVPGADRAKYVGNLAAAYGGDADWTGGFLKDCWGNFDGIAEHWYASPGVRFNLDRAKHLPPDAPSDQANDKIDQTLLEWARYPSNFVRVKAEEWQGYQQRFPAMLDKKIFLSVDEYAYFGGDFAASTTLKQALAYGMIFDEMLRHTDWMTMTAHTMGTSTLDFNATASTLNPLGLAFKVYSNQFAGAIPVKLSGNSPQPEPKFPPSPDQPKSSAGSPTYPLDAFAALTPDRKHLVVAVVNATEAEHPLDLTADGIRLSGTGTLWRITAPSVTAANHAGKPAEVELKESPLSGARTLAVAPISVNIYRFDIAQ